MTAPSRIPEEAPGLKGELINLLNYAWSERASERERYAPGAEREGGIGRFDGDLEEEGGEGEERESNAMGEEREREGVKDPKDEQQHHDSLAVQQRRRHGRG